MIASRVSTVKKEEQHPPVKIAESTMSEAALQDLMLQAEILVQYGMRAKAMERLQRIRELFPREEERNPDLQRLYLASGFEARYVEARAASATESGNSASADGSSPGTSSPSASSVGTASAGTSLPVTPWHDTSFQISASQLAASEPLLAQSAASPPPAWQSALSPSPSFPTPSLPSPSLQPAITTESSDVSSLAKVAEITRKLYHQGNAEGVLKTAASEIGGIWQTARCIAALRKPGLPASSVQEHHRDGLLPVSAVALASVVESLQDLAVTRGTAARS